jgi:single-strand DNA-binding protein
MYQNKVTLIGFLGNNAEVHTADDRSFTTFQVATKSSYKDKKSGEYVSHTEWHRCVVFSRFWEFAGTLTKGTHVQVEGELRSREYVPEKAASKSNKAAAKQRIWEIRVASILKLDRAEKFAPEEQEQNDSSPEEVAF